MARTKGSLNKVTVNAQMKAQELGIDPFEVLLLFAKGDWEALGYDGPTITKVNMGKEYEEMIISPDTRMQAAKDATQFLLPKRKAIEHSLSEIPEEVFKQEVQRRIHLKILKGEKVG